MSGLIPGYTGRYRPGSVVIETLGEVIRADRRGICTPIEWFDVQIGDVDDLRVQPPAVTRKPPCTGSRVNWLLVLVEVRTVVVVPHPIIVSDLFLVMARTTGLERPPVTFAVVVA